MDSGIAKYLYIGHVVAMQSQHVEIKKNSDPSRIIF
jgi:hypothetical protein